MNGRMLSGIGVGKALKQAANRLRRQQDECLSSLRKLDSSIEDLVDTRGQALLNLARHYLPKITHETVVNSFEGVRDELLNVLVRKQGRERQLSDRLQSIESSISTDQTHLDETTDLLHSQAEEQDRLEEMVINLLLKHDEFQKLSRRALIAEEELERNEQRVAEIKNEAKEKLPSYEKDRLFRYLIDRDYGKPEYKKRGLTRMLDRWVAKLVNFDKARRSYDFLRVTPELMAAEVLRRREQFNVLMEQVEGIEDQIAEEVGLTNVMRRIQELGSRRDKLENNISENENQFSKTHEELINLDGNQNEFYEQGLERMRQYLSEMQHSWLEHQSRSTPERKDDELVAEIGWQNDKLQSVQRESASLAREQRIWDDRAAGLQDVLRRFRKANYDSRRSQFSHAFDVSRHVDDFIAGRSGSEQLWSAIRQYQQFAPTWQDQRGWEVQGPRQHEDMSSVLGRVLIEVAGEALKHAVRRGMERRGPSRSRYRKKSNMPPFRF